MKENKSKFIILGILRFRDMTGYDIKKSIDNYISTFWFEDYGRIYTELKRLEEEGLVKKYNEIVNNRNHIVYSITEKGNEEFEKWLERPLKTSRPRNELLLKIFFGNFCSIESIISKVEKKHEECLSGLKTLEGIEKVLTEQGLPYKEYTFWRVTLLYGKYMSEAISKWCDESLTLLNDLKDSHRDTENN